MPSTGVTSIAAPSLDRAFDVNSFFDVINEASIDGVALRAGPMGTATLTAVLELSPSLLLDLYGWFGRGEMLSGGARIQARRSSRATAPFGRASEALAEPRPKGAVRRLSQLCNQNSSM
jgi:hypothetical protein